MIINRMDITTGEVGSSAPAVAIIGGEQDTGAGNYLSTGKGVIKHKKGQRLE